ncbi:MAG: ATP-binding protein, partial [Myxococcales bacterium]|nr:ATP-binding protein [Myxococcales bacterium]
MKHNPGFMAADELVAAFVARRAELGALRRIVADNGGSSNQHVLVIGRRGLGKTMLVHRLAIEIREDPELSSRWYPVVFGEESYNVATAGELWLEALLQIGEQTKDARWLRTHDHLLDERDDQRLREAALARLLDFADEQGKRLLLMVENLQAVLGDQMSEDEGWVLRHTLLNEPRLMLLATATNRFDEIDLPRQAAYELFHVLELEPLDGDGCRELWQALTGELLPGRSIRPVEIFTGGNLRLLVILAQFAAGRTFRAFARDLLELIDDHSDYFKGNLESLPLDERRVFTALCDRWAPSLAREVARGARFDVNKTSMLLGRLARRGAVEVVGVQGRSKRYQVVERLYNLFYLLRRRGARESRLRGLVEFMVRFYAGERLEQAARWIAEEAVGLDSSLRRDNVVALSALIERLREQGQVEGVLAQLPEAFWYLPEVVEREELKNERDEVGYRACLEGLAAGLRGMECSKPRNQDWGLGWMLGSERGEKTRALAFYCNDSHVRNVKIVKLALYMCVAWGDFFPEEWRLSSEHVVQAKAILANDVSRVDLDLAMTLLNEGREKDEWNPLVMAVMISLLIKDMGNREQAEFQA